MAVQPAVVRIHPGAGGQIELPAMRAAGQDVILDIAVGQRETSVWAQAVVSADFPVA